MSNLTIIDFHAEWCGPCKVLSPVLEKIEEKNPQVKITKINVDEDRDLTAKFGVRNIPTVIFSKDGEVVERVVGAKPESFYQGIIDKILTSDESEG